MSFWDLVRADRRANPRDPKSQVVLFWFRASQRLARSPRRFDRLLSLPLVLAYRSITELVLGIELRPKTEVGPGLALFHGFGLVVNDHAVIGANVTLRNGVTIGHKEPGGKCPRVGNNVQIGAGAILLGDITIGDGAIIGAGSVVTKPVPPAATVVGNPARQISRALGE